MYCLNCGAKNTNNASYCFQCGAKLNHQEDTHTQLNSSSNRTAHKATSVKTSNIQKQIHKRNRNVVIWVLVIIVGIIGVGIWYNNTHYNSTFQNNFLSSCENNGGSASRCSCMYTTLKTNYTYSQAKYFNANLSASDTQSAINWIASQCTN